jgi:signal transduction histidine kinase
VKRTSQDNIADSSAPQFQNLSTYLQRAREEERKSVAREIHDELGQALTTMKLELSLLREEVLHDAHAATERIQSLKNQIDETIHSVKRIITKLRPGLLDDLGLPATIEWQSQEFQKHTGIICTVTIHPDDMVIDSEIATAMFRIFQEVLTNIMRHAKASRVEVRLTQDTDNVELVVQDNGIGISPVQINNPQSFGLIGIRERVRYWQGELELNGSPGQGTTISVRFPLNCQEHV